MKSSEKLGLLGPLGTFTTEAGDVYCRRESLSAGKHNLYNKIGDCFDAVQSGLVNHSIVPLLNSTSEAGWVNETLVRLKQGGVMIYDEVILPIRHNLLGLVGTDLGDLRNRGCYVHSKDKALQQCGNYLSEVLGEYNEIKEDSTARAVEKVAVMKQNNRLAIGSKRAAEIYGLEVLAEGIEDNSNNKTRFVVIGNEDHERTGYDKTSVLFEFNNTKEPALLSGVLNSLAKKDLSLLYIQSLPKGGSLEDFTFYCDIEGHKKDEALGHALSEIERDSKVFYLKVLGSYPRCRDLI